MSLRRSLRHRHLALAAAAGGALVGLSLLIGPTLATPASPPTHLADTGTEFATIGNGALPTARPSLREGRAPLSIQERGYAATLALRAAGDGRRDVLGNPGAEVLLVDLPLTAPATDARIVLVSLYDYASDRTLQATVNLTRDSVDQISTSDALQLPPSMSETAVALRDALDGDVRARFLAEYERLTGAPLIAPEQVVATGSVWRGTTPQSMGDATDTPPCGAHRCVQLLIALPSGRYLDTSDFVVDLSAHQTIALGRPQP
jgi:hypothetical protein